jgi:F0F1-type ATP synthase epsilon subunit
VDNRKIRWLLTLCIALSLIAIGGATYAIVTADNAETVAHKSQRSANEAREEAESGSEEEGEENKPTKREDEERKEESELRRRRSTHQSSSSTTR